MAQRNSLFENYMLTVSKREKSQNLHSALGLGGLNGLDLNENVDEAKLEPLTVHKYEPQEKYVSVNTMDMAQYFFPLLFASEKGPLGIWEKQEGMGHVKRRIETDGSEKFHVIEISSNRQNTGTCISAPKKEWMALHVALPHLVIVVKNLRRNFSFEVQVLDSRGFLRRFNIATWFNPANLKKWPFLVQLPLQLEFGWNEIHLDLNDLLWKTFKSSYFETVRLVINASCRLRQVFFCADNVINGELGIPSMQRFENMKMVRPGFGGLNHPNYTEPGPNHSLDIPRPEPALVPTLTRVEKDLRLVHIERFNQLSKLQLREPYRSYFKELLVKSKAIIASPGQQDEEDGENNGLEDVDNDNNGEEQKILQQQRPSPYLGAKGYPVLEEALPAGGVPLILPPGGTGPLNLVQIMQKSLQSASQPSTSKSSNPQYYFYRR